MRFQRFDLFHSHDEEHSKIAFTLLTDFGQEKHTRPNLNQLKRGQLCIFLRLLGCVASGFGTALADIAGDVTQCSNFRNRDRDHVVFAESGFLSLNDAGSGQQDGTCRNGVG